MKRSERKEKKWNWRKELRDWGIIIAVFTFLYAMGWHTEVIGRLQGLVPPIPVSLEFQLINLKSGERVNVEQFRGKVLVFNFWASWCPPCVAEIPSLETLYESFRTDSSVVFFLINLDQDIEKAKQFIRKKNIQAPVYKLASPIPPEFSSSTIPTTFIVSGDEKIVFIRKGAMNFSSRSFRKFLNQLAYSAKTFQ